MGSAAKKKKSEPCNRLPRRNEPGPRPESAYDELCKLAATCLKAPISIISFVDRQRAWTQTRYWPSTEGIADELSLCRETIKNDGILEVRDLRLDARFQALPSVSADAGLVFYAGVAINLADGVRVGTISVIDHQPRTLSQEQRELLRCLAGQAATLVDLGQKAETMDAVQEHSNYAFLMVDEDLTIAHASTKCCQKIFGKPSQVGNSILDLIDFSPSQASLFRMAAKQVFEDILPEKVSLKMLPNSFEQRSRHYQLQSSAVRNRNQKVTTLLLTIVDCSDRVRIEKEAAINQALLRVARERSAFQAFAIDTEKDFTAAIEAVTAQDFDRYRAILHTLKGNFSAFGLSQIAKLAHDLEDEAYPTIEHIKQIQNGFEEFLMEAQMVLGLSVKAGQAAFIQIKQGDLQGLKQLVTEEPNPAAGLQQRILAWIDRVQLVAFESLLSHTITSCYGWAAQLGKQIEIKLTNPHLPVEPKHLRPITKNLVHLLNNAIDHGIEAPENRGTKKRTGSITIHCEYLTPSEDLMISVQDDGQGLDLDAIRNTAIKRSLRSAADLAKMNETEIALLIFEPGFSTSSEVSNLSGRGVGMSALRESLLEIGGEVEIHSRRGQGTTFSLRVPAHRAPKLTDRTIA